MPQKRVRTQICYQGKNWISKEKQIKVILLNSYPLKIHPTIVIFSMSEEVELMLIRIDFFLIIFV